MQDYRFGLPTPDDAVRDYLVKTSVSDGPEVLKTNYLKFLSSVFACVKKSRKAQNR